MDAGQGPIDPPAKALPISVDYGMDDGLTLAHLLRSLWAKKLWVILPVFIVSVLTLVTLFLMTPQYTSTTSILVEDRQSAYSRPKGETQAQTQPDELAVASHVQLLMSNDLATRVMHTEKLADLPEFNQDGKNASLVKRFLILIGAANTVSDGRIEENVVNEYFDDITVYQVNRSRVINVEYTTSDPAL